MPTPLARTISEEPVVIDGNEIFTTHGALRVALSDMGGRPRDRHHHAMAGRTGGVVLAGGRSSRFGAEKATAPFEGRLMMDAALDRFAPLARRAVSARAESTAALHAHALGLPVLADAPDAPRGPLAGVAAALSWAKALDLSIVATAPCDTPFLPLNVFPKLLEGLGDAPAACAVTECGEHPLCAVWRVELAPRIADAIANGQHPAVRDLVF